MKIDPGFINHWKTELLIERLGSDGVVAVLRLWGNAQIRRQYSGLDLNPRRLALETKWKGNAKELFDTLTDPDAPWLDKNEDGTFSIHDFGHHQKQVVALWENGNKGGRPRKVSPAPSSKEEENNHPLPLPLTPLGFKMKPNGFEKKPNGFCGEVEAAAYDSLPQGNVPDMLQREKRIQSLKRDWKLPFTYAEQQVLMQNAACLDGITDEEFQTIKDWLYAKLPQGDPCKQPYSRIKFLEWLPDVYRNAMAWRRKNPIQTPTAPQRIARKPGQAILTREEIEEMMKP